MSSSTIGSPRWLSTYQSAFCTGFMAGSLRRRCGARLIALAVARVCRTSRKCRGSTTLEAWLAFLHERRAALAVVGAVEAGAAGARDRVEVAVGRILQNV